MIYLKGIKNIILRIQNLRFIINYLKYDFYLSLVSKEIVEFEYTPKA